MDGRKERELSAEMIDGGTERELSATIAQLVQRLKGSHLHSQLERRAKVSRSRRGQGEPGVSMCVTLNVVRAPLTLLAVFSGLSAPARNQT